MKSLRITLLTLLFFTGFIIPSCTDDGIDCSGCPEGVFFDVEGMKVDLFQVDSNGGTALASDTLAFTALEQIYIDYEVDYHACAIPTFDWSFALMNTANACSCVPLGDLGSKTEKLMTFSITTLNDFDEDHPAGTLMNDLFEYVGNHYSLMETGVALADYLADATGEFLATEDMILKLKKAPAMDSDFQIKVTLELSTGEKYEIESLPVYLRL